MAEAKTETKSETKAETKPDYQPPKGNSGELKLSEKKLNLTYTYEADWIVLRKKEKPVAEVFHVAYRVKGDKNGNRPVTFVFNGGPGAASLYLHLGGLGPQRIHFEADGRIPSAPAKLVPNLETWLTFTDLVFVDPVGTGFSRRIDEKDAPKEGSGKKEEDEKEFFALNRDLEALGEFMTHYLSKAHAWSKPVFIAGESYGGFRVAKLARKLQESYGIGLSGVIAVSPAFEMTMLNGSDYDVVPWIGHVPSMAAAAQFHGKAKNGKSPEAACAAGEKFVHDKLGPILVTGQSMLEGPGKAVAAEMAALLGVSEEFVSLRNGRVTMFQFVRELLREKREVIGLYDASMTAADPFPDRDSYGGGDPTLSGLDRAFGAAINTQLREVLGVKTDRAYHSLNMDVNNSWKIDGPRHALETQLGGTDDLRYGMTLNPHMKVLISHGIYDLVTPYYHSDRLARLMKLPSSLAKNLQLKHFYGGHMFYMWEESRKAFFETVKSFYQSALN